MFHLKFLTENVSSKMSHSECLIQSVSFEMSQKSFIQNISKNVFKSSKKKTHLVGISLTSQYSRQKGFPIYHLSEGAKSLFSR